MKNIEEFGIIPSSETQNDTQKSESSVCEFTRKSFNEVLGDSTENKMDTQMSAISISLSLMVEKWIERVKKSITFDTPENLEKFSEMTHEIKNSFIQSLCEFQKKPISYKEFRTIMVKLKHKLYDAEACILIRQEQERYFTESGSICMDLLCEKIFGIMTSQKHNKLADDVLISGATTRN